jgi:hypothetical protein
VIPGTPYPNIQLTLLHQKSDECLHEPFLDEHDDCRKVPSPIAELKLVAFGDDFFDTWLSGFLECGQDRTKFISYVMPLGQHGEEWLSK